MTDMKVEIDFDEYQTRCLITQLHGHTDMFVDFFKADKFSQLLAMNAFKEIIDKWGEMYREISP